MNKKKALIQARDSVVGRCDLCSEIAFVSLDTTCNRWSAYRVEELIRSE